MAPEGEDEGCNEGDDTAGDDPATEAGVIGEEDPGGDDNGDSDEENVSGGEGGELHAAEPLEGAREPVTNACPQRAPGREGVQPGQKFFDFALDSFGHNGRTRASYQQSL